MCHRLCLACSWIMLQERWRIDAIGVAAAHMAWASVSTRSDSGDLTAPTNRAWWTVSTEFQAHRHPPPTGESPSFAARPSPTPTAAEDGSGALPPLFRTFVHLRHRRSGHHCCSAFLCSCAKGAEELGPRGGVCAGDGGPHRLAMVSPQRCRSCPFPVVVEMPPRVARPPAPSTNFSPTLLSSHRPNPPSSEFGVGRTARWAARRRRTSSSTGRGSGGCSKESGRVGWLGAGRSIEGADGRGISVFYTPPTLIIAGRREYI
jgi:hypothetical protein